MKQFNVYLNDKWIDKIYGSKAEARRWVARNVTSTHMGQWIRLSNGFEYATTIGQYYQFIGES